MPANPKKQPMRMCVSCREMRPKRDLIRIVKGQDGELFVDGRGKAPGRGAYICSSAQCLARAIKTRAIDRALGAQLRDELKERLRQLTDGEGE